MTQVDRLKKLERQHIANPDLCRVLDEAIANYSGRDKLLDSEIKNCEMILKLVETHFPLAAGISSPEPEIDPDDLLNTLKETKSKKVKK